MAEHKLWQSDEEFDELLRASLSSIQPPADFSDRVMRAVRLEEAAKDMAAVRAQGCVVRTPLLPRLLKGWTAGLGSCAAALLLFCAVAAPLSEAPGGLPFDLETRLTQNVRTAALLEQPSRPEPQPAAVTPAEPVAAGNHGRSNEASAPARQAEPAAQTERGVSGQAPQEEAGLSNGVGELVLPRAAYGSRAQGTLSVRLLAQVEGNAIYAPSLGARGKSAAFYTADEQNIYTWQVDLTKAAEPDVTAVAPLADGDGVLAGTASPVEATTLVESPDGTMLAQNSREGVWISLAEGEVFLLTQEGAGRLLVWSPDSSKVLFTNESGALFVGYPLERRIYQVTDMAVKDVCWSGDSRTVVFQAEVDGQDCLYVAEAV